MEFQKSTGNRIAIIGATGYGGLQSVKLLSEHPHFQITYLGGDRSSGKKWNDIIPFVPLKSNLTIASINPDKIASIADYAILSLPNGLASQITPFLIEKQVRILDLSADYRFDSLDLWKSIYSSECDTEKRTDYELCKQAIYGIPEFFKDRISKANLVSCPGCFPTGSLLLLIPFLQQGLIENDGIIIDSKTGTSGGGRIAKEHLLFSECSDSMSPYGVIGHRHTSEIEQIASFFAGKSIQLQFTPHLTPMVRGILSTVYARLRDPGLTANDCKLVLDAFYQDKPFIKVLPVGTYPSTKWVKNTNKAYLSVQVDKRNGRLVLMSSIDNLLKGQAGQALQNLNIMHGLSEETSIPMNTLYP